MELEFLLNQHVTAQQITQLNQKLSILLQGSKNLSKRFSMYVKQVNYNLPTENLKIVIRTYLKKGIIWQESLMWKEAKTEFNLKFQQAASELEILYEPSSAPTPISLIQSPESQ